MYVLGFSVGHDKGAVLIKDGEVVVGITEERITRVKHDGAYNPDIPRLSMEYCIKSEGIGYDDISLFVYNLTEITDSVESQFVETTSQPIEKLMFIPHHISHAFSTFHSSGFDEAAVLVADAMGSAINEGNKARDWYSDEADILGEPDGKYESWAEGWSIYKFNLHSYEEVKKKWVKWPLPYGETPFINEETTIGGLYGHGARQLVYSPHKHNWVAGKLMGLASYAESDFVDGEPVLSSLDEDGYPVISANFAQRHLTTTYESDFRQKANVAGIYQREQERLSMILVEKAKELTGMDNICVAGGSFLNCNTNEMIIKSGLFEDAFFIPPADDSGIPLGCAWYAYCYMMERKSTKMISPYFGKVYTQEEIMIGLDVVDREMEGEIKSNCEIITFDDSDELVEAVSNLLVSGKVIGWMQGGSEIGPRALGNRSILANPSFEWMQDYINGDIKGREWYRPFAPSVLYEEQSKVFELDTYSPHMLVTTNVKEDWRNKIPSVTHIDNTSRYQSVTKENNPLYHKLISKFNENTGIPLVLNTSFNGPDEPIVESPYDAIRTFWTRGLSAICVENVLIIKKQFVY